MSAASGACHACGKAVHGVCGVWRSIPLGTIVSFILAHVGIGIAAGAVSGLQEGMSHLGESMARLADDLGLLMLPFTAIIVVNIIALVLAVLGSSGSRHIVNDCVAEKSPMCVRFLACLTCRCTYETAAFFATGTFVMSLIFCLAFVVISVLLIAISGVCVLGGPIIDKVQALQEEVQGMESNHRMIRRMAPNWIQFDFTGAKLHDFCQAPDDVADAAVKLFVGSFILTISQFGIVANLYCNRERMIQTGFHVGKKVSDEAELS